MIRKFFLFIAVVASGFIALGQNRFPKPDFESGYQYPTFRYVTPDEGLWNTIDLCVLTAMMSVVAYAVLKKKKRTPVFVISILSVLYFGFFRTGCVCSIGAVQNVALSMVDESYVMPVSVFLFFILPVVFALLFGRVFCAGVCPFGALQELVNVKNIRLPRALSVVLGIVPWIYLIVALLYAVTRTRFIICRFDPFVGIFRLGGDFGMIAFGVLLLVAAVFTGRPFCRFICPYGALLSLFSRVSVRQISITEECNNCDLCRNACPVDAIRAPYENRVKEKREAGVRRVVSYLLLTPVVVVAGAVLLRVAAEWMVSSHAEVQRLEAVVTNTPTAAQAIDKETFIAQGGTVEALTARVEAIKAEFKTYAAIAGGLIGLVIALTLISLSLKRKRKTYEIDHAACIDCGRCFSYCPKNQVSICTEKLPET